MPGSFSLKKLWKGRKRSFVDHISAFKNRNNIGKASVLSEYMYDKVNYGNCYFPEKSNQKHLAAHFFFFLLFFRIF